MAPRRAPLAAAALLMASTLAACGGAAAASLSSKECKAARANEAALPRSAGFGKKSVAVIGDSWATGWHEPTTTVAWEFQLAAIDHWHVTVLAFPGAGYVNQGPCGRDDYATLARGIPPGTAEVVVESGVNDHMGTSSYPLYRSRIAATLSEIGHLAPGAPIYVLGIPQVPLLPAGPRAAQDQVLETAAGVDAARWVSLDGIHPELQSDHLHPTVTGDGQFARYLAALIP